MLSCASIVTPTILRTRFLFKSSRDVLCLVGGVLWLFKEWCVASIGWFFLVTEFEIGPVLDLIRSYWASTS